MSLIYLLALIGALLIFAEMLLMFGIFFIVGAFCFLGAFVISLFNGDTITTIGIGVSFLVVCGLSLLIWTKVLPRFKFGKKMFLNSAVDGKSPSPNNASLVGKCGIAATELVPSGVVEIDGKRADAFCENGHCQRGENIEVVGATSFGLKVRKI